MRFDLHSINDCYRCPECNSPVAEGDQFCRGCGVRLTSAHVTQMKKSSFLSFGVMPWNTRDRYRCPKCEHHVSVHDNHCRDCGVEFDEGLTAAMKEAMRQLVKMNTPSLIMVMLCTAAVILFAMVMTASY
ncbi:zinc ribbon domain-containing protein [Pseudomonadota bacterium]